MAVNLNLTNLGSIQNDNTIINAVNANNTAITNAFQDCVARDGTTPNTMTASLDMNSNHIINLPSPTSNFDPVRFMDVTTIGGGGTITVNPLPTGGTIGQTLTKNSSTNFDASWATNNIPTGGTTGQYLKKNSSTNYDTGWATLPVPFGNVFNVMSYGAKRNYGASAGSMAIGSSTLTTSAPTFNSGDVGKYIAVGTAGTSGATLFTTIATFNSSTSIVLSAANASGSTVTNQTIEWGNDDAAAFQLAWNACITAGGGIVYAPTGSYFISQLNMTGTSTATILYGDGVNATRLFPFNISAYTTSSGHMFDMSGSGYIGIHNLQIGSFGTLAIPKTCIFMATQTPGGIGGRTSINRVYASGQYSISTLYNYGCPSLFSIQDCDFYNYYPGSGFHNVMTLTGTNLQSLTSAFLTVATGTQSTSDILFNQVEFHKFAGAGADNAVITLDTVGNVQFNSGVITGGSTYYVTFYGTNGTVSFLNVTFETESQPVEPTNVYNINSGGVTITQLFEPACSYINTGSKFSAGATPTTNTQNYFSH